LNKNLLDLTACGIGKLTVSDIISITLAMVGTIIYYITDSWVLNNIIGVGYVIQVVRILTVKKMYVVTMLLT